MNWPAVISELHRIADAKAKAASDPYSNINTRSAAATMAGVLKALAVAYEAGLAIEDERHTRDAA